MLPHAALPCVAPFPPAALPAFNGTMGQSDSLRFFCLPPSSVVRHTPFPEENTGPPGLPRNPDVRHAMVTDPGEVNTPLPLTVVSILTSVTKYCVVLPDASFTGLNPFNLSAYGLSARCPTLKAGCYHTASKDSLPSGWPTFRGGHPTRWITRPCPAARLVRPRHPSPTGHRPWLAIGHLASSQLTRRK
jgi:hypothetical protein